MQRPGRAAGGRSPRYGGVPGRGCRAGDAVPGTGGTQRPACHAEGRGDGGLAGAACQGAAGCAPSRGRGDPRKTFSPRFGAAALCCSGAEPGGRRLPPPPPEPLALNCAGQRGDAGGGPRAASRQGWGRR